MRSTAILAIFVLGQMPLIAAAETCATGGPMVTAVDVHRVMPTRYLNFYHVNATVTNRGAQAQPSNVLQVWTSISTVTGWTIVACRR